MSNDFPPSCPRDSKDYPSRCCPEALRSGNGLDPPDLVDRKFEEPHPERRAELLKIERISGSPFHPTFAHRELGVISLQRAVIEQSEGLGKGGLVI